MNLKNEEKKISLTIRPKILEIEINIVLHYELVFLDCLIN
jgi:hypothetical protein